MNVDMAVQPQSWAQAFQAPRMTAADAKASVLVEREPVAVDEQPATEERHHVSWETYNALRQMLAREQAEKEQLRAELRRLEHDRDHWHMKANHNDIELQTFARRRNQLADELRRQDTETLHPAAVAHAA